MSKPRISPRKFSEKIALLEKKESEINAEFEKILREVEETTRAKSHHIKPVASHKRRASVRTHRDAPYYDTSFAFEQAPTTSYAAPNSGEMSSTLLGVASMSTINPNQAQVQPLPPPTALDVPNIKIFTTDGYDTQQQIYQETFAKSGGTISGSHSMPNISNFDSDIYSFGQVQQEPRMSRYNATQSGSGHRLSVCSNRSQGDSSMQWLSDASPMNNPQLQQRRSTIAINPDHQQLSAPSHQSFGAGSMMYANSTNTLSDTSVWAADSSRQYRSSSQLSRSFSNIQVDNSRSYFSQGYDQQQQQHQQPSFGSPARSCHNEMPYNPITRSVSYNNFQPSFNSSSQSQQQPTLISTSSSSNQNQNRLVSHGDTDNIGGNCNCYECYTLRYYPDT